MAQRPGAGSDLRGCCKCLLPKDLWSELPCLGSIFLSAGKNFSINPSQSEYFSGKLALLTIRKVGEGHSLGTLPQDNTCHTTTLAAFGAPIHFGRPKGESP